ncbi:MAG: oligosaccharide flippase family protein [candidate division KSB1 bacterium]|nr:oligosaccharide flippase family protein [candidate division KSB1 bacterium]MDZ7275958.1 oligosaccharide flippase family protein [candidate division KSB1 bacterium]MDZ7285760.1 oligosaccharide flippase family protein [candidate division KSB1 bacterium]MDZ7298792.1 oligosaccharide flippase family protein [candidate division KSB1 bacterium]MDZ7307918.1 oligosaccharide flippase family protein [candidate division KSB1 bacterium]
MFASIKRLTHHSLVYGLGHMLARSLGFLLIPLHTNVLPSDLYGIASLLFSSMAVMTIVYGFGLDSAFLRYYIPARSPADKHRIFATAFWAITVVAALFSLVAWIAARPIADWLFEQPGYSHLVQLAAANLFCDALAFLPLLLLRAEERSVPFIAQRVVSVALSFLLNYLFLLPLGRGLAGIFEANLLASLLSFLLLLPLTLRHLRFAFDRHTLLLLLRFGLPFLPSTLAVVAIDQLDRFLLRLLTDLPTVGIYSAGYRLGLLMSLLVTAFRFAWVPFFMNTAADAGARAVFARVLTYFMFVCAVIFLAMSFFLEAIVRLRLGAFHLFGEAYWSGMFIVPIVMLAYWLYGVAQNFLAGITLQEKTAYFPLITGTSLLVNAGANLLLIPLFGMAGAAWATVAAYAIMALLSWVISQRLYFIAYECSRLVKIVVVTAVFYGVHALAAPAMWWRAALLLSFPLALAVVGFFEPQEWRAFQRMVARRLADRFMKKDKSVAEKINP